MEKLDILKSQLTSHIKYFDLESNKHKRIYRRMRYTIFFLTAASTILAGFAAAGVGGSACSILVIIVTAMIGVLTSVEGLRKPSELWLNERSIYHALEDLRREVEFHGAEPLSNEEINGYFQRAQGFLGSGSARWKQYVLASESARLQPNAPADRLQHGGR